MAGRRRFGRVRKLPSGRWQARYRAPDGQDHRAPETFTTKTAADRWLAALETDLMRGQWIDPRAGAVLLSTYVETWLAGRADLKVRTQELYRWLLGKYVVPQLGHLRLEELTPSTVRAWHATLLRDGSPLYGKGAPPSYSPMMRQTGSVIDAAGNVWSINNWKPLFDVDAGGNPGGDGILIFVGVAAPPSP